MGQARCPEGVQRPALWGIKYFDINNHGNVTVSPQKEKGGAVGSSTSSRNEGAGACGCRW